MNADALRMGAGLTLYVGTGILQPLLIDALRIHGHLGRKRLLLPTLANTMGMACCGLLVHRDDWRHFFRERLARRDNNLRKMICWTAGVDLVSGMLLTAGILQTGGAIFVILYNSCPMWTAFLSRALLGKRLTWVQTMGVLIVCVGLVANVFGEAALEDERPTEEEDSNTTFTMGVFLGSIMVLVGSLLHSLMFVLSEMALSSSNPNSHHLDKTIDPQKDVGDGQISGPLWSSCLGTLEASVMSLWVLIGTGIGGFHDDDSNEQRMTTTSSPSSSSYGEALGGFVVLLLVDTLHAAAFFQLLQKLGALPSALLKGVQTVAVVGLSLLFFCPMELSSSSSSTACLTPLRALSVVLVISGVVLYGVGSGERLDERSQKCMNVKETSGSGCNESLESSCCATLSSVTKDDIGTGKADQDTELKRLL